MEITPADVWCPSCHAFHDAMIVDAVLVVLCPINGLDAHAQAALAAATAKRPLRPIAPR